MKIFTYITLFIFLACASPKGNESIVKDLNQISLQTVNSFPPDSLSFVGFVRRFDQTNEFYIELHFKKDFDYAKYTMVESLCDSSYHGNEFESHSEFPMERANEFFDLTGLATVDIYDAENKKISTEKIKRIEYLQNTIESEFIAVLEVQKENISDYKYCIGNKSQDFSDSVRFMFFKNDSLDLAIGNFLNVKVDKEMSLDHFKSTPDNTIYSIIRETTIDTVSYIIEVNANRFNVLYKTEPNTVIHSFIPLPRRINGHPILLVRFGLYSSDGLWTSLLTFNGTVYQEKAQNRINTEW